MAVDYKNQTCFNGVPILSVMCINTEESELVRKTYSLSRQMKVSTVCT